MLKKEIETAYIMPEYIYLVPVGEQIEPLIEGFRYVRDISRVYLLCTSRTKQVAKSLQQKIAPIHKHSYILETSADDLDKIITDVLNLIRETHDIANNHGKSRMLVINLTGGTKMMSLGCYIAGLFFAERILYIFKKVTGEMQPVEVPVMHLELADFTKKKGIKLNLLKRLMRESASLDKLTKEFNLSKPTVWAHMRGLEEKRLVEKIERGKSVYYALTTTGKLLLNVEELKYGRC